MRKPAEFENHPASYADARSSQMFRAVCRHVVDGDTFDVFIDLGLGKYAYETVRLHGIDTPEIFSGPPDERSRGQDARQRVALLINGQPLLIKTFRDAETFGRYVADAYYQVEGVWTSLADTLRDEGFVK